MNNYKKTLETYNSVAKIYEEKYMKMDLYNHSYDEFCKLVKSGGKVLELACGPGNIGRYILNERPDLNYLATDAAENMVELAKKNLPEAEVKLLDFRELASLNQKFDGIVCGFGIPYLSKEDCVKFMSDCSDLLTENGVFYLSFVPGSYEDSHLQTSSDGKHSVYFHFYETEFVKAELKKSGLKVLSELEVSFRRSEDKTEIHTVLFAGK